MNNCIFCQIVAKRSPAHIIYENDHYLAFLDKYPQTRGHLQLIPKTHYRWVWEIPQIGTFFTVAQKIIRAIIPVLSADYVTLTTRGDEVHHAHLWIVPQYRGTRAITEGAGRQTKQETLQEVARILRGAIAG